MAAFVCALTSLYVGIILQGGPSAPVYNALVCFVSACGAIYTVTRIRQRSDLYRAGGVALMLAAFMILAIDLQQQKSFQLFIEQIDSLKYSLMWAAANGILVSILAIALMPMFEELYGRTTDIRLLELSQKTELLQKLEQEAPGSYQHSMRVATLAETASQAIGANALLTRVGCYYHDIGKVFNPQYFVENQQSNADKAKHSKITPNMSCLIIRNHVKHGIEMARQNKLPEEIVSFIPEHHGTTLMAYFYHQALAEDDGEGKVKEDDYRYPGPKPQMPETAIVMLADALEATSRLLDNPSERDVRQLVRKIINERFMDGQFDECDLTLKDLHTLYHSFSESIMHTLHQRIAYPGPPSKDKSDKDKKTASEKETASQAQPKTKESPNSNGESTSTIEEKPMVALKEKEKRPPDS
ncbi:HDIG domain-containing protein [bacterium]|nr:HDIG domain-containing protein [bacterium]